MRARFGLTCNNICCRQTDEANKIFVMRVFTVRVRLCVCASVGVRVHRNIISHANEMPTNFERVCVFVMPKIRLFDPFDNKLFTLSRRWLFQFVRVLADDIWLIRGKRKWHDFKMYTNQHQQQQPEKIKIKIKERQRKREKRLWQTTNQ